jgi:hypothetical protein
VAPLLSHHGGGADVGGELGRQPCVVLDAQVPGVGGAAVTGQGHSHQVNAGQDGFVHQLS